MAANYEELRDKILAHVHTEQQFRHLLATLQTFLEFRLFSTAPAGEVKQQISSFFETRENDQLTKEILTNLGDSFYAMFTVKNIYEVLEGIEKSLEEASSITLYIPVELPRPHIEDVVRWLRKQVHPHTLATIIVEPDMGAGCALERDGVYHDFSLRYFLRKHEQESYQAAVNRNTDRAIREALRGPDFRSADALKREDLVQKAVATARREAANDVMKRIPDADRRKEAERRRKVAVR